MSPTATRAEAHRHRIGIDVGGTFTDVVLVNEATGAVHVSKILNSHVERSETVLAGIEAVLGRAGIAPSDLSWISHGTTITTNAVIERKGAVTALITNQGFRDVLEIGRFSRPAELIYRVHEDRPAPFVPRFLRLGVSCRIDRSGSVVSHLHEDELDAVIETLRTEGVEAVAFLFSFLDPSHERAVRERLAAVLPDAHVVISSEILREFREFPRTSTTVFAAYVAPTLRRYLETLVSRLEARGIEAPLYVFQSNGGIARPDVLMRNPALTLLSGPAGAVVGAAQICGAAGFRNIVTMDMGGTSLDVCLVRDGAFETTQGREIDHYPVALPMLKVETVGAGGGSVVRVDEVGRVTVGPGSMGANPGPACYGRGGDEATLTDVNVVLGLIDPATFAGGEMALEPDRAEAAVQGMVASRLNVDLRQAAAGVYRIVTSQIAEALQQVTAEGGHDPRDFVLVAFGGGGPLHACAVAREVGMAQVLVPRHPGLFSARGIALSDFFHDYVQSAVRPLAELEPRELIEALDVLEADAQDDLQSEGVAATDRRFVRSLDLRYVGQTTEINVPVDDPAAGLAGVRERFDALHEQLYSYFVPGEPIELVNVRLRAVGLVARPPLPSKPIAACDPDPIRRRPITLPEDGRTVEVPVFRRDDLRPGHCIEGPALVEEASSTTFLVDRSTGAVDGFDNLLIEIAP